MPDGLSIPGGPVFIGFPQPPDVPCDPTGDGWRGPPGPQGVPGIPGIPGPPGTTTVVGGLPEAPADGAVYGRQGSTAGWLAALPLTGGTLTGRLAMDQSDDPASNAIIIGPYSETTANTHTTIYLEHNYNFTGGSTSTVATSLGLVGTVTGAPSYNVWQLNAQLNLSTTGVSVGQHLPISSTVRRFTGATPAWCWFSQHLDLTGQTAKASSQTVGSEMDILCNGPEIVSTAYDPHGGGRCFYTLIIKPQNGLPHWAPNKAYTLAQAVQPTTANGFTYYVTTPGTSGGTEPTWPTSAGTVTDGTVVWAYGTTIASQVSRGIAIAASAGTSLGASLDCRGTHYDAVLELSGATLDTVTNPNAAAIRIPANAPIDLSGNLTQAGQNQHILAYRSATQRLYYTVAGVDMWSVDASGNVRARGTITGSTTP